MLKAVNRLKTGGKKPNVNTGRKVPRSRKSEEEQTKRPTISFGEKGPNGTYAVD